MEFGLSACSYLHRAHQVNFVQGKAFLVIFCCSSNCLLGFNLGKILEKYPSNVSCITELREFTFHFLKLPESCDYFPQKTLNFFSLFCVNIFFCHFGRHGFHELTAIPSTLPLTISSHYSPCFPEVWSGICFQIQSGFQRGQYSCRKHWKNEKMGSTFYLFICYLLNLDVAFFNFWCFESVVPTYLQMMVVCFSQDPKEL